MNIKELSSMLNVSEHYILHHFKDICKSLSRKNIMLVKCGKGRGANYGILRCSDVEACFEYKSGGI